MDARRWGKSRTRARESHDLLSQFRILRLILGSAVFFAFLLTFIFSAQSACRDPDVARGFGSLAYAANVDATIQYFGHNFFLITTSKGTRIVTDPLGPGWYPNPNVIGDVVTVGKEMFNHNAVQIVLGNPVILRGLTNYGADWNKVSTSVKDTLSLVGGLRSAIKGKPNVSLVFWFSTMRDHPLGPPTEQHHFAAAIVWRICARDPSLPLQAMQ